MHFGARRAGGESPHRRAPPPFWMLDFCSRMQEKIENLVKLQALDLERARLNQAVRALPAEVAQADAALKAAQRDATTASDALSREETLRTRLEREASGHIQKAASFAPSATP